MSSNPLIPDEMVRTLRPGEWRGLVSLLRAFADGEPERATAGTDMDPHQLARNYADELDKSQDGGFTEEAVGGNQQ